MPNLNHPSQIALKKYLEEIPQIQEKITGLSKGPWSLTLTIRYDRKLFVNNATSELDYLIDFKAARVVWEKFVASERMEATSLKEGNLALQDYLQKSIIIIKNLLKQLHQEINSKTVNSSLNKTLAPLKIALKNGNDLLQKAEIKSIQYLKHCQTHQNKLATIEDAFNKSKTVTKEKLLQYLKKQSAGQKEALNFYEGYEKIFTIELEKLNTIFLKEIPIIITDGKEAINNAKAFTTNLQELMNKALIEKNLQILFSDEGM